MTLFNGGSKLFSLLLGFETTSSNSLLHSRLWCSAIGVMPKKLLGKKAVEIGRYYGSEALRSPKLKKKAIDYAMEKGNTIYSDNRI